MGADVIKVEPPEGDMARGIGPFTDVHSLYFSSLNTGKRGIVLNLTLIAAAKETVGSLRDVHPSVAFHATVVHGDPVWGNLFIDQGHLSGVIDFEWVRIGHLELVVPAVPYSVGCSSWIANDDISWLEKRWMAMRAGLAHQLRRPPPPLLWRTLRARSSS